MRRQDGVKKTSGQPRDDLRPHYDFNDERTKPNKFAGIALKFKGRRTVFLDEDVADAFDSSEAVNTFLRSAIKAMRVSVPKRAASNSTSKRRAP